MSRSISSVKSDYDNFVFQFGRKEALASKDIIWDGAGTQTYLGWLSAENFLSVVSDSADDKVGSGGATAIIIKGQGSDGKEKEITIPLNGTTVVNSDDTSTEKFECAYEGRIASSEDLGWLNGPNHGTITVYEKGQPTHILMKILPANGHTFMAMRRIPSDKYAELLSLEVYPVSGKEVVYEVHMRESKTSPWRVYGVGDFDTTNLTYKFGLPKFMPPGADIIIVAIPSASANVSANFELELLDL